MGKIKNHDPSRGSTEKNPDVLCQDGQNSTCLNRLRQVRPLPLDNLSLMRPRLKQKKAAVRGREDTKKTTLLASTGNPVFCRGYYI
jgi:hypothetical protein